jgi:hypothetical protein
MRGISAAHNGRKEREENGGFEREAIPREPEVRAFAHAERAEERRQSVALRTNGKPYGGR